MMLFVVAIWNVSCSKEALEAKCSILTSPITNSVDIPDRMENMLEVARTLNKTNNYGSMLEMHVDMYGDSEQSMNDFNKLNHEMNLYGQLGYNGYINKQMDEEILSPQVHAAFSTFQVDFLHFLDSEPNLDEFKGFVASTKLAINETLYCASEVRLLNDFYDLLQGAGQYFYKHYSVDGKISTRGCNFWEALGCFALSLIVAIVGTIVGFFIFIGAVVSSGGKSGKISDGDAEFLAIALGLVAGVAFMIWCCGTDEVEEQECFEPTGSIVQPVSCNSFKYTVYGPSDYGLTDWTNTNLTPVTSQTSSPSITVEVIDPNQALSIDAKIACLLNGTSGEIYNWSDEPVFEVPSDNVNLNWVIHPQSAAQHGSTHQVKVSTPNGVPFTYEWSINNGNTISGSGNTVNVTYFNMGFTTINVKVTNTCTNQIQFLSGGTYVYQ